MEDKKIIISMIRHYLNVSKEKYPDTRIEEEYPDALYIALNNYNKFTTENRPTGVASITQGSQSISYSNTEAGDIIIDSLVRSVLPRPFLKMY